MDAPRYELLEQLVAAHAAALVLYARQWCPAAEDVVQDALLQLMREPALPERPVAWLFRVVRNRAISIGRSQRRRQRHEAAAAFEAAQCFETSADDALDAAEAARALSELPADLREVLVARIWGGLSFEEIGELVGTSASSAHRQYRAGLTRLRERLNATCPKNGNSLKS